MIVIDSQGKVPSSLISIFLISHKYFIGSNFKLLIFLTKTKDTFLFNNIRIVSFIPALIPFIF